MLQVRLIIEKLARRCGFDAVQAAVPASDSRLLSHIRRERTRKEVRKVAATSQVQFTCPGCSANRFLTTGDQTDWMTVLPF